MVEEFVDGQKEDKEHKGLPKGVQESSVLARSASAKTLRRGDSNHTLVLNVKIPQSSRSCTADNAIFQRIHGLDSRIPKDVVSLDEKYLRRCLELIHNSASKAASFKLSFNLTSSVSSVPSDSLNLFSKLRVNGSHPDCSTQLVFDYSLGNGTGEVVASPPGQWIVGSIMGSKSMINIMRNPLFHQSGTVLGMSNSGEIRFPSHDVVSSQSRLSLCSSTGQGRETTVFGAHDRYGIDTKHRRLVSVTSTNSASTGTDRSSVSASSPATVSQGMLHITWKGGTPHFVFSLDEQKEIYITSLMDIELTDPGAPQHLYTFYSRPRGQKKAVHDKEPTLLVGRMTVATSIALCSDDSKVLDTEFVLSTSCETHEEAPAPGSNLKRSKGLPKKVAGFFRNSHSSKQRSISQFDGTISPIVENSLSDASLDACSNLDALGGNKTPRSYTPANFELAAIIVRAHSRDNERQVEGGGWGLKFLRRVGVKKLPESSDEALYSDGCTRNTGNCSTSIDVVLPAGIHGGPRTRNGGPSTLTSRWRSGGQCDCGGWDLGCPLTLLRTRSTDEEVPSRTDTQGTTKSFDLYLEGSKQGFPCLRMMNVHDGLYVIHFQSILSALQSFSIAVAHIHSQSPILRPKLCKLKERD